MRDKISQNTFNLKVKKEFTMTDLKFIGFYPPEKPQNELKFSNVPLDKLPLTMAYVPMQQLGEVYSENDALDRGTLFPELDKPFRGKFTGGNR